jgi:hypothetical protein
MHVEKSGAQLETLLILMLLMPQKRGINIAPVVQW